MPESIVRMEDAERYGLLCRYVFGLNLLAANEAGVPPEEDPRVVFLNALIMGQDVAAHMGYFGGEANIDADEFGPSTAQRPYVTTRQNLCEGDFWQEGEDRPPAFLFPLARQSFLDVAPDKFEYMIRCGSIALYAGIDPNNPLPLLDLAAHPASDIYLGGIEHPEDSGWDRQETRNRQWLEAITGLCRIVVVTERDGHCFAVYARNPADFALLDPALATALNAVETSAWYRQNSERLAWDSGVFDCLVLLEKGPEDRYPAKEARVPVLDHLCGPFFEFLIAEKDSYWERRGRVQRIVGIQQEFYHHPDALRLQDTVVSMFVSCLGEANPQFDYWGANIYEGESLETLVQCLERWTVTVKGSETTEFVAMITAGHTAYGRKLVFERVRNRWDELRDEVLVSVEPIIQRAREARRDDKVLLVLGV